MSSRLETSFENLAGQTTQNGIFVERLVSKRPAVVWACKCVKCGTEFTVPHSKVRYAACPSSLCGQSPRKRDRLDGERQRARARERAALEEEVALSEARMLAEVEDYKMPSKHPPVAGNTAPETERQRLERQAWRDQQEAEERAEHERREAPIRAAEEQLQETHRRIAEMQRERLTRLDMTDEDMFIDPAVAGASMPMSEARERNLNQWMLFYEKHPEFYPSNRNIELLHDYHERNNAQIYTSSMLEHVYLRMLEAGVEFDQKPPEPEIEKPMQYDKRPQANLTIGPPSKAQPQTYDGWDDDGNPRQYTEREVSKWSSDEMRRKLRLYPDKLALPSIGPGPMGTRYQ